MAQKKQAKKTDTGKFRLVLDKKHPANVQVLASFFAASSSKGKKLGVIAAPTRVKDPYMNCGSHPDVVERVWDQLGRAMPEDGRCLLYGSPALVHPKSGVILAVSYGTVYAIRLPAGAARPAKKDLVIKWTTGGETNIEADFGQSWMFGDFSKSELDGFRTVYEEFS